MGVSNVLSLLGGIALFLFGMTLMGEGLKRVAGNKLEMVLYKLSSTPLKGMLLGTGVTAVIQSSSATSVMVVGFVNSGIMKLPQAISIVIGAIIGTSVTGWIVCLSSIQGTGWTSLLSTASISSIVALIGILFRMFSKDKTRKLVGDILLGFAVLMFGMQYMSSAVAPLRTNQEFIQILTAFSNPVVGALAGLVFAAILQSASAAVGILQALSLTGVISFSIAWPILLGISVGASLPVLLSSIGAKVDGKRTAWAYFMICLIGAAVTGLIVYIVNAAVSLPFFDSVVDSFDIALTNTLFRLAAGFMLLPFVKALSGLLQKTIRESDEERAANEDFDRLDERFIPFPAMAVEQSRITVYSMARKSKENLLTAIRLIFNYSSAGFSLVEQQEDYIDKYEDRLGTYLLKINTQSLSVEENERVTEFLHIITDLERISDHAMNIAESAREIHEKKIVFSDDGKEELNVLIDAVKDITSLAIDSFIEYDIQKETTVEPLEELIDNLCSEMKLRHVNRMQNQECSLGVGFVFNDLLSNFERVGDHCSNIALALIEIGEDDFDTHKGANALMDEKLYGEYSKKYALREISR